MSLFGLRVIGLILGALFGFPRVATQRINSTPRRYRGGRLGCLFLMMGVVIAGNSSGTMAVVSATTELNVASVDQIPQPDTTLDVIPISQSTQDTSAYPDAKLNTTNLAGPIPTEPLYSNSLLTDAVPADTTTDKLDPEFGDLSNDLFNDPYVDLFVLGDLYLGDRDFRIGFENTSFELFANSFLTVPEPTGAAILGCSVLGFLAKTQIGRGRVSSRYTNRQK